MAVVLMRGYVDDENAKPVERRDLNDRKFGVTLAKKHPPYVFSIRGASCLIHKVAYVELHWYRITMHKLIKLKRPYMMAHSVCGYTFFLEGNKSRTCQIPNPDALPCGRCHGEGPTFPKRGPSPKHGLTRQEAHVKLGCVVLGY